MNAMQAQLQGLLLRAKTWEERIKKTTGAQSVSYVVLPTHEFRIFVRWVGPNNTAACYEKTFDFDYVFGPAQQRGPSPCIRRTLCSYMHELMQNVMKSRGI